MRIVLLVLSMACLMVPIAQGAIIVVDAGGAGDAISIQGGLDLAVSGDQVRVMPGVYAENISMKSGVQLRSAFGPEATIIDGLGGRCIECVQCAFGTLIEGFTLTNAGGYSAGAVWIFDYSNVEVAGNIIRDNNTSYEGAGVQIQRYSYGYVHDNQFIDNLSYHSCAMSVIVYSQAVIENNLFHNNVSQHLSSCIGINNAAATIRGNWFIENHAVYGAAIHAVHPPTYARIERNSFVFNHGVTGGASCLRVYGEAMMVVNNNIFAFNEGAPALDNDSSTMQLACNAFWENYAHVEGLPNPDGVNGNQIADPMVCDPLTENVALSIHSYCLNGPCGFIGANEVAGCTDAIPATTRSWGEVKTYFR